MNVRGENEDKQKEQWGCGTNCLFPFRCRTLAAAEQQTPSAERFQINNTPTRTNRLCRRCGWQGRGTCDKAKNGGFNGKSLL